MLGRSERWLNGVWYGDSRWYLLLLPLSYLYRSVTSLRRVLYQIGVLRAVRLDIPVIVVGNISIGGTGKTPLTILLAQELKRRGRSPGIVSRGYRGKIGATPESVHKNSDPARVGDEPVLLARRADCPVVVHPDRVAAGRVLQQQGVDVIIADDGLQHYRLARDMEVAVVDGERLWGNGQLLPAGPLREPLYRLQSVDHLLLQQEEHAAPIAELTQGIALSGFSLRPSSVQHIDGTQARSLDTFKGECVHGVAAIGNPEQFFVLLEKAGIEVVRHPFPDHATLTIDDLRFAEDHDIIMTEKDAVKFGNTANKNLWYLRVSATIHSSTGVSLIKNIEQLLAGHD